jgi:ElaB/YqjD/DUF883 family membrane-anchored ribosome-binding protein
VINCSVDQIYDFSNEITRAIDYCHFNMSGFDEIFRLIEDKCNTLRLAGDNAFSQVNNSISKANYAITVNKREISSLKDRMNDLQRKIYDAQTEEEKAMLKKTKDNVGYRLDRVYTMVKKLEDLVQQLHRKADSLSNALKVVNNISSNLNTVRSSIEKSKATFSSNMENIKSGAKNAEVYVSKIDECLSYVSNSTKSSSKVISIKGPNYLFNMASSLNNTYNVILDSDSGYAKALYGFSNVIQDEVSRGVAEKGKEMLEKFDYELKDFPSYASKFMEAGNALKNYENLKLR